MLINIIKSILTSMNKTFDKSRPLSWSSISSFEYNPEQWYKKYVLGETLPITPELIFGKIFADSCEARTPLAPITMLSQMEHPFAVVFGKIPLVGYADTFCKETLKNTGEFKTGVKKWDQKRVDDHGQITMYALMNYITNKVKPDECEFFLEWIPTKKVDIENGDFKGYDYRVEFASNPPEVHHFKTKRTMQDLLNFGTYINKVYKEMENYCIAHN